ncbi:MAG: cell division protein FtsQ/DivIB [Pseudoxanthomonas suwonensis]|nr:cell division protein FtsQ/DivIB [Pseudoxanthomonas suwonensis]
MNALLRIAVWLLAVALVAAPVVALVQGWAGTERWPLRTLRVEGQLQRVDPAQVQVALLPHAARGFFAVRMDDAQAAVAQLPWVESAEVNKHWPDVLEVRIVEHEPFARWGEDRLLSAHGRLFPVGGIQVPEELPLLDGPDAAVSEVVALYNHAREQFAGLGMEVEALRQDARGSWSLQLSSGTRVILGSHEARSRLQRFVRLLPRLLASRTQPLERADLRYTNGFALVWGDAPAATTGGSPASVPGRASVRHGAPPTTGRASFDISPSQATRNTAVPT